MKTKSLILLALIILLLPASCKRSEEPGKVSAGVKNEAVETDLITEKDTDSDTVSYSDKEESKPVKNQKPDYTKSEETAGKTADMPENKTETVKNQSQKTGSTASASRKGKTSEAVRDTTLSSADKTTAAKERTKAADSSSKAAATAKNTAASNIIKHLVINSEPVTVSVKDGFENAGVTAFICDNTDIYYFKSDSSSVKWDIYILPSEFKGEAKSLIASNTPDLNADGNLKIRKGRYVYIVCSESSLTAEKPSVATLAIDYSAIEDLSGNYNDSVSKRARATVKDSGDAAEITVSWSSSADDGSVWKMNCKKEGNRLVYTDCSKTVYSVNESGDDVSKAEYVNGKGYFTVNGNTLLWDGAAEESCRECKFEKKIAQ